MNLKSIAPVAVLTAVYGLGGMLPLQAREQEEQQEAVTEAEISAGQVIPFACHDRAGNVIFTTINPQETVGWELGCREVQYESNNLDSPPLTYFQCYDVNGGIAFNTIDADVAEESDLFCREIGTRVSTPVPARPIHYECYNTDGTLSFTTSYPQETYGWKPGCRELQYRDSVLAQVTETPRTAYECFDVNGNVAFTTFDPQEVRQWKLGCREFRQ